jgi:putative transposase
MESLAYCLMSNHVHLIVVGRKSDSLARAIGNAHRQYSREINRENGWTGHLWANRFYSTALDDVHLWIAARYVETNPLRADMVASAVDYRWSSARAHCCIETNDLLAPDRPFPGSIANWATWLDYGAEEPGYEKIRRNTATGRPTGSPQFKSWIEERTGRTLIQGRSGRRRKIRK